MAAPTLKGPLVPLVRWLSGTPVVGLLRSQAYRTYGVGELFDVPVEPDLPLEREPRPLQGGSPRGPDGDRPGPTWRNQELGAPSSSSCTARDLCAAYQAGRTDPVTVLEQLEQRLSEDWGEATHSPFVGLDIERARGAAQASAERYRTHSTLGHLDGVPVPVKDEHHMVGLPTMGGTAYRAGVESTDS
ncbi:MAG: amidase family protein, partial [Myxococcota bacterium]|nr:amidase family protein [Myxococcota bacterium]